MRSRDIAQLGIINLEEVAVFVEIRELRRNKRLQLFFRRSGFMQLI